MVTLRADGGLTTQIYGSAQVATVSNHHKTHLHFLFQSSSEWHDI
jgi:hypothetical protein